jgi:DNA polymerase elongation subunit (family B)
MTQFILELENEIKWFYFFKGQNEKEQDEDMDEFDFINKPLNLLKKNYIYVTTGDKVVIKNLGLNKKSNSPLSKKIFWEYLVPQIKTGNCKFSKVYIQELISKLLKEDISLAVMRKEVGVIGDYEKSPTSLPAQISQKYGVGIHFLIPNLKGWGVGKGKSYTTLEDFKQRNGTVNDVDLSNVMSELEYFIKPQVLKNIFEF